MAIVLTIEDGTGVIGANSYVSVDNARAYANGRGIVLPSDDDVLAALLIQGYDFLNTYECDFSGVRTYPLRQTGAWPRTNAMCSSVDFPENAIPYPVQVAQIQIAIAANSGIKLFPTVSGAAVKRQKVGPIEREFETATWNQGDLPVLTNVAQTLSVLTGNCGQGCGKPFWKTVRV